MNLDILTHQAEDMFGRIPTLGLRCPRRIIFGIGCSRQAGEVVDEVAGAGPVMVIATAARMFDPVPFTPVDDEQLSESGMASSQRALVWLEAEGEPSVASVDAAAEQARALGAVAVVGYGGGSAIDLAKAVAAMAVHDGSVAEYVEGGPAMRPLSATPLTVIALPTTAGTGAEMTRNAVVCVPSQRAKRSLRNDRILPAAAIIDPAQTMDLPPRVTAACGMDALTQLLECCISTKARPETTALAMDVLPWIRESLPRACQVGRDRVARTAMMAAASVSGVCLANSGLGLVHGVAASLGVIRGMPHGVACGLILPHALRWNRDSCESHLGIALAQFVGSERAGDGDVIAQGIALIDQLNHTLGIPANLKHLKLSAAEIDDLCRESMGSSMSGNPHPMTPELVRKFLAPLL